MINEGSKLQFKRFSLIRNTVPVQRLRKDIARKDKMMNGTAKKSSTAANNNSNNIMMEDYEGDGNTTVIIAMREELDALRKQNKRLKNSSKTTTNAQYERLKEDSTLEIKRLRKECKSLQTQLNLVVSGNAMNG